MNRHREDIEFANYDESTGRREYDLLKEQRNKPVKGLDIVEACIQCGHIATSAYCPECGARKAYFQLESDGMSESKGNLVEKMMGFFGISKN